MSDVTQQSDIAAVLGAVFPSIAIMEVQTGVSESEVDAMLTGSMARSGKLAGMVLQVGLPVEKPSEKTSHRASYVRQFPVRVIELVKLNRPTGGSLVSGYNYATMKTAVIEALHGRGVSGGTLAFGGAEAFFDTKGGYGYDIAFTMTGNYAAPAKAPNCAISFSGGLCTIDGGGATVAFTTNGDAPLGGTAYTVPFAVTSGQTVRAVATESGKLPGDFMEGTAP